MKNNKALKEIAQKIANLEPLAAKGDIYAIKSMNEIMNNLTVVELIEIDDIIMSDIRKHH